MNIDLLKEQIKSVMPLLIANRDSAYKEWMNGDIARGAFEHIQGRIDTACIVIERNDLDPEQAYKACALITIDLRCAIEDNPTEQSKMDSWLEFFRNAGFIECHKIFNFPIKPVDKPKEAVLIKQA